MKYFFILLFLIPIKHNGQALLSFEKRFVHCEDKWVAFQADKDSSHPFGFIYIDQQAGLTLNYEGSFKITSEGKFVATKLENTNYKVRLKPNNVLVALIPENKFKELEIQATPEWLENYKNDTNSVSRLHRWGFLYNGWGECAKALTYLERAQQTDPKYKGLAVELAYSYNCMGRFENAIEVLTKALSDNPNDAYTNKELIYAQMKSGQLDKASESCRKAIEICEDTTYNGENCYNLLYSFYTRKDKPNFNLWLNETKKWNNNNEKLMKSIAFMEMEINK